MMTAVEKQYLKIELARICSEALKNRGYDVSMPDPRTLMIRVHRDGSGPSYFEIQVKERY